MGNTSHLEGRKQQRVLESRVVERVQSPGVQSSRTSPESRSPAIIHLLIMTMSGVPANQDDWIHLGSAPAINKDDVCGTSLSSGGNDEGKAFSRLLYTNPVCFLCHRQGRLEESEETLSPQNDNVMIVSWLTATNNRGKFIMSLNKRRQTAQQIMIASMATSEDTGSGDKNRFFTLCVPVAGMEELILAVGGVSGRMANKFPPNPEGAPPFRPVQEAAQLSKRQQKKQRRALFSRGIPGLSRIGLGEQQQTSEADQDALSQRIFCIKGTVAHLVCRVDSILEEDGPDDEHVLLLASVLDAYCHKDYWDGQKMLFRPAREGVPPYLTFFGSQQFGYVQSEWYPS